MSTAEIIIVLLGALAAGLVAGLTGFGTGITAMGIWLYAISPSVAASLVIVCSVVSQVQTFPMIWRAIEPRRVLPFIVPGLVGVPIGTRLLAHIDPKTFKIGVGLFLLVYSSYMLFSRLRMASAWGGRVADGFIGFWGGILGGLTGFSGVLPIVWTDVRGWAKDERRSVLQAFNLSILLAALLAHGATGLLTKEVGWAIMAALPGTITGAWFGASAYQRLNNSHFQDIVLGFLFVSGSVLIWTSL